MSRTENAVVEDLVTFSIDKDGKAYMAISKPERKAQIDKLISLPKTNGAIDIDNTLKTI